ncbi:MAG: GNAT family N-acetyltransferase [Deltaproteobacteria bacterium]|nr:MAG: GNAT family N-acetyltransferase [Deltaproteobacteria bacterium]
MPLLLPAELRTERLRLARPMPDDAPRVAEAVHETLSELAQWFQWGRLLARYGDIEDMGGRAVSGQTRFDELDRPVWFIWEGDRFVGEVLINNPHWDSDRAVELQIWLRKSAWGRGLAREAANAAIRHLFEVEGCAMIEALIGSANASSRKLFTSLGFKAFGVRSDHNRYLLTPQDLGMEAHHLGVVVLSHPECLEHEVFPGHPEQPARIEWVLDAVRDLPVTVLGAPRDEQAPHLAHTDAYLVEVERKLPDEGSAHLDPDTDVSSASFQAALRGAGGCVAGVDLVLEGRAHAAFIVTRPPGHHAMPDRSMGFCLLASCAIGALHAVSRRGLSRVAIVDFDVHHGNGTEAIVGEDPRLRLWSLHEQDLFPMGVHGAVAPHSRTTRIPLPHRSTGAHMREVAREAILPAIRDFEPQMILVSAGFDAHQADPNSTLQWRGEDYAWLTAELMRIAPVVSTLEGGYSQEALTEGARAHVAALVEVSG